MAFSLVNPTFNFFVSYNKYVDLSTLLILNTQYLHERLSTSPEVAAFVPCRILPGQIMASGLICMDDSILHIGRLLNRHPLAPLGFDLSDLELVEVCIDVVQSEAEALTITMEHTIRIIFLDVDHEILDSEAWSVHLVLTLIKIGDIESPVSIRVVIGQRVLVTIGMGNLEYSDLLDTVCRGIGIGLFLTLEGLVVESEGLASVPLHSRNSKDGRKLSFKACINSR